LVDSTKRLLDGKAVLSHHAIMDIGLGLWTMRATARYPAAWPQLYEQLRSDARFAESLGFHSLWVAEHHFWYDGWTPSPLAAAATALAATSTLHVGTGIHLLPLYEQEQSVAQLGWLARLSGGRLEHGVGIGYRASEYDGYGISRRVRGKRMDAALDRLVSLGDDAPQVWVGGFAGPAVSRAGRLGLGLMLPSTLKTAQLQGAIAEARAAAEAEGRTIRIGVMKYAWATDGSEREYRWAVDRLGDFTREYSGSWFPLKGRPGFEVPDLLEAQMKRSADTALIGSPAQLLEQLRGLEDAGAELCVLHLIGDGRLPERRLTMTRISEQVLPQLRAVAA
jgi:alkanesulfonate monooxygenase SsuD/methylene tetrahydromethanopterin reductase-like flavin-dependent oxidoreductase (luciferase family)